jgi:hypothetical protein
MSSVGRQDNGPWRRFGIFWIEWWLDRQVFATGDSANQTMKKKRSFDTQILAELFGWYGVSPQDWSAWARDFYSLCWISNFIQGGIFLLPKKIARFP